MSLKTQQSYKSITLIAHAVKINIRKNVRNFICTWILLSMLFIKVFGKLPKDGLLKYFHGYIWICEIWSKLRLNPHQIEVDTSLA